MMLDPLETTSSAHNCKCQALSGWGPGGKAPHPSPHSPPPPKKKKKQLWDFKAFLALKQAIFTPLNSYLCSPFTSPCINFYSSRKKNKKKINMVQFDTNLEGIMHSLTDGRVLIQGLWKGEVQFITYTSNRNLKQNDYHCWVRDHRCWYQDQAQKWQSHRFCT